MAADERSYCATSWRSAGTWLGVFLGLLTLVLVLPALVPAAAAFRPALLYGALGGACLFTYRRCRTAHCAVTGPAFLLIGAALALQAAGVWPLTESAVWIAFAAALGGGLVFEIVLARRRRPPERAGTDAR